MKRYEHLVKHYDKQLLSQLKNEDYEIKKICLEIANIRLEKADNADKKTNPFNDRVAKIEELGHLRNRFHFEFNNSKNDFEKSKSLFYQQVSLAVQDGLITNIGMSSLTKIAIKTQK